MNGVKSRGILPSGLREKVLEGIRPTRLQLSILRRLYHIVKDALEACEDLKLLSPRYRWSLWGAQRRARCLETSGR
ncbi:hypothetical protein [Aeropyrum camini]|uniref:hypothetical protein n=1 Tax=Aeropyrum camini TaxID=229980 RepID=UPI00138F10B3|nr:hypothetical protein [Aeropyrum camini]